MKIGQPSEMPALVTQAQTSGLQKPAAAAPAATPSATASKGARSAGVAVSATLARALEHSDNQAAADVDTAKVQAVKTAIENGTYSVNAEAIADKLLSNAQEMLHRTVR